MKSHLLAVRQAGAEKSPVSYRAPNRQAILVAAFFSGVRLSLESHAPGALTSEIPAFRVDFGLNGVSAAVSDARQKIAERVEFKLIASAEAGREENIQAQM